MWSKNLIFDLFPVTNFPRCILKSLAFLSTEILHILTSQIHRSVSELPFLFHGLACFFHTSPQFNCSCFIIYFGGVSGKKCFFSTMDWESSVLVCLGCCNKLPRTEGLKNNKNVLLTILEAGSQGLWCWKMQCSVRVSWFIDSTFLPYPHGVEGAS